MPAARKTTTEADEKPVCDNHPERPAVHVTSGLLHRAIALCEECLRQMPHLKAR